MQVTDKSIPFMPRTEVIDVRSGAHLGHVFNGKISLTSHAADTRHESSEATLMDWPEICVCSGFREQMHCVRAELPAFSHSV